MINYDNLEFDKQSFPVRKLDLTGFGEVFISTTSLSEKLINSNCGYYSDSARIIDEKVFYYVEDSQIFLNKNDLKLLILNELL